MENWSGRLILEEVLPSPFAQIPSSMSRMRVSHLCCIPLTTLKPPCMLSEEKASGTGRVPSCPLSRLHSRNKKKKIYTGNGKKKKSKLPNDNKVINGFQVCVVVTRSASLSFPRSSEKPSSGRVALPARNDAW